MRNFTVISVCLLLVFFIAPIVYADLGNKPSMQFNFVYKTSQPVTIIDGIQLECEDINCLQANPLEDYGPQGFSCRDQNCRSLAYGYDTKYHKLIINFSDKQRESNIFTKKGYDATYNVTVLDNELIVTETTPPKSFGEYMSSFLPALIIVIILEFIVTFIFLLIKKKISKILLLHVIIANIVSLPIVWFIIPLLKIGTLVFSVGIIFAILFEAYFLYYVNKKKISLSTLFVLSLIMNILSLWIGGIFYISLFLFG